MWVLFNPSLPSSSSCSSLPSPSCRSLPLLTFFVKLATWRGTIATTLTTPSCSQMWRQSTKNFSKWQIDSCTINSGCLQHGPSETFRVIIAITTPTIVVKDFYFLFVFLEHNNSFQNSFGVVQFPEFNLTHTPYITLSSCPQRCNRPNN